MCGRSKVVTARFSLLRSLKFNSQADVGEGENHKKESLNEDHFWSVRK